jgi:micrococcal nuclease
VKFISGMVLLCAGSAIAHPVVGITDGDTLTILRDRQQVRIRIADIDAPESKMQFGQRSKQSLSELCYGRDAVLEERGTDRYGRTIARVKCDGIDVSRAQVERGLAWHYVKYSTDSSLGLVQQQAKVARRGLWSDPAPIPPWDYRHK